MELRRDSIHPNANLPSRNFFGRFFELSDTPPRQVVQQWSQSFKVLLSSHYGTEMYWAFLRREYSQENLDFWIAVRDYKEGHPFYFVTKARKIYKRFLKEGSSHQVNLDADIRSLVLENLEHLNEESFDQAQWHVQFMLEHDSYPRFIQYHLLKAYLNNLF